MDALRSLVQPLVGGGGGSSMIDGMKLVVLGGTVETARRVASSGWSHFINSFFLTAHFSEEDYPYDWLMLWLSRRPEWQRSREFETTTRSSTPGFGSRIADNSFGDEDEEDDDAPGRVKTRVVFQPTANTTHTIYYRGHWLRVKRWRKSDTGSEVISVSVVARNNSILKQLVLQAKKEYEAEAVHRIQIYFADSHGCWRWTDSRHKRPMSSIVLNPGVKEMLLSDTKDFLKSEKWYADRGIPFRRGYLLYGVPGSGKSSLIHAIAGELMLDIYVVSLSSSWVNDGTLTTLMGRVPARCIVLLEDLDAAFTRSTSRDGSSTGNPDGKSEEKAAEQTTTTSSSSRRTRQKEQLSDVNTLTLSGLLNALDGVAASEGRLLFATTNHLERLDPALSRPGRMDVWIEFKNASKWQAEQLFRNFFPSTDEDDVPIEGDLDSIELPMVPPSPSAASSSGSTLFSLSSTFSSVPTTPSGSSSPLSPLPSLPEGLPARSRTSSTTGAGAAKGKNKERTRTVSDAGLQNQAYLPPPVEAEIMDAKHSAKPLDGATLAALAKKFADSIPDEEFSVAALQGCECSNFRSCTYRGLLLRPSSSLLRSSLVDEAAAEIT
ncbi:P-loop containing nucleoside triphosphate hydrolase protein [Dichomitus squalens]|uniref:P-loop containing nucleoside triphosphate hydrolase protein n=1 Tax=Dichomitus squalens TaxID=114155 RepID=A0A4Q9PYQ4_9APHY|nr:P-loop containing nucleoside triphosphate hydrolase protein [Dichomitus squalens LYAD-421 SS1]EJF65200.1 P-loop containing nucleoside triphosphate hydrolase protein [Dichomitus squalens LYAD-421 SS1]TBU48661.1 P-loop containing nucleoside triphosphate hydrolase protein [Dichomitus squalens]TBU59720.1 P-loop containing nucleoside triphosphate hydrolase protein [Dichomitus squalens]